MESSVKAKPRVGFIYLLADFLLESLYQIFRSHFNHVWNIWILSNSRSKLQTVEEVEEHLEALEIVSDP